jgi:beta-glucosidase
VSDHQFYEKGFSIFKGMQLSAPDGVKVEYTPGFDINGQDQNMDHVLDVVNQYDAVVMCVGEHVYSECKLDYK